MRGPTLSNVLRWMRRALFAPLALAAVVTACNRADEFESCVDTTDPGATSGQRNGECPASLYVKIAQNYRDIAGRVWAGENGTQSTLRVEGTAGFGATKTFEPVSVVTDAVGNYATVRNVPFAYDVTAAFGTNLLTVRGLGGRFFELSLDDPFPAAPKNPGLFALNPPLARVFSSHVGVQLTTPLPAGKSLAFFTLGDTIEPVSGDLETGLEVVTTTFTAQSTLYGFQYDTGSDLSSVSAYGKVAFTATSGSTALAVLTLQDIPESSMPTPRLDVTGPDGFSFASLDVIAVFSRLSRAYVTTLHPGVAKKVPLFTDSLYTAYRLLLTRADGATIDSGVVPFGIFDVSTKVAMEAVLPPVVAAPDPGATVALTDPFYVSGPGVYEHTFAPQGTGTGATIHVLTADGQAHLPSFADSAVVPHGTYTWTVRAFSKSTQVTGVSGRDARRAQPSATAAPRTIVFP